MNFIKQFLKLLQVVSVVMMPIVVIQYYVGMFNFIQPFNEKYLKIITIFFPTVINGMDWTIVFLILPWVLFVILFGIIINILEAVKQKAKNLLHEYKSSKLTTIMEEKKQTEKEELKKKTVVYFAVSLNFSKFTLSNLSEEELEVKKREIKEKLFKDISSYKGKFIEEEEFEISDTLAFLFVSQEDVLNFIFKFKEIVSFLDNDIQGFGYSLNYKIVLDVQMPEIQTHPVLEFLEKALKTVEVNEIVTTNSFADRYKNFGAMKHISFHSKGTYSINKIKVELNRLLY